MKMLVQQVQLCIHILVYPQMNGGMLLILQYNEIKTIQLPAFVT